MKKKSHKSPKVPLYMRKSLWVVVFVCVIAMLAIREALYLSAGPVGEKDCGPDTQPLGPGGAAATLDAFPSSIPWEQHGGTINDASCLDRTAVYGIVKISSEKDVADALAFAQAHHLKISTAGVRHSMGGQAFATGALVLDMRGFNQMALNESDKTISVQSGATWHAIQNYLHPKYAVKAMQSTDIFTVGGSISVNAHGMDHQAGSVGDSIRQLRVMHPDGSIEVISRTQNPQLFNHVVGGYGLFGVILDATLDVEDNVVYQSKRQIINYQDFPQLFSNTILSNKDLGLFYGHLSTARGSLLREMILYTYTKVDAPDAAIAPLSDVSEIPLRRLMINFSKLGSIPMYLKWWSEKYIEPKLEACDIKPRTQAMGEGEGCLVSRNEPMHDSVPYLKNNLQNDTDILHEYFIPRDQFTSYVDDVRQVLLKDDANLLNASVRVVHKESVALNYAPEDMFALVLYLNQKTDAASNEKMAKLTRDLIDTTLAHGGTFFLPYQLYYTQDELHKAYPNIDSFFAAKKTYDPDGLFTNTFYEKYAKI